MSMPPIQVANNVKELIAILRAATNGSTWYSSNGQYGFCSIYVYNKDGEQITEILNKG